GYAGNPTVAVVPPREMHGMPDALVDLIVANSLIQYLGDGELYEVMALWRQVLKPDGLLVIGDVIPKHASDVYDALTLLRFGWEGGFLIAAALGLLRILFSDYRRFRRDHGIFKYDEAMLIALFAK